MYKYAKTINDNLTFYIGELLKIAPSLDGIHPIDTSFLDVLANFKKLMEDNPDTPQAVAAISTLIEYINQLHSGKNTNIT